MCLSVSCGSACCCCYWLVWDFNTFVLINMWAWTSFWTPALKFEINDLFKIGSDRLARQVLPRTGNIQYCLCNPRYNQPHSQKRRCNLQRIHPISNPTVSYSDLYSIYQAPRAVPCKNKRHTSHNIHKGICFFPLHILWNIHYPHRARDSPHSYPRNRFDIFSYHLRPLKWSLEEVFKGFETYGHWSKGWIVDTGGVVVLVTVSAVVIITENDNQFMILFCIRIFMLADFCLGNNLITILSVFDL